MVECARHLVMKSYFKREIVNGQYYNNVNFTKCQFETVQAELIHYYSYFCVLVREFYNNDTEYVGDSREINE